MSGRPIIVTLAGEADRVALRAQARGAADAMHVVLGVERQVVVVDVRHAVDVQAARGDVGGTSSSSWPAWNFFSSDSRFFCGTSPLSTPTR